jgi:hypothetical protein
MRHFSHTRHKIGDEEQREGYLMTLAMLKMGI